MDNFRTLFIASCLAAVSGLPIYAQYIDTPLEEEDAQQTAEAAKTAPAELKQEDGAAVKEGGEAAPSPKETSQAVPAAAEESGVRNVPEKKPAAVINVLPSAAAPTDPVGAECEFFKAAAADKDDDAAVLLLPQLADFVAHHPDGEYAAEAQLLKASLHLRLGDYKSAVTDLLRHIQEYPKSASAAQARKLFDETVDKKADKKIKPFLAELANAAGSGDKAEKAAVLLKKLAAQAGEEFYGPVTAEYREFFNRFPAYSGNDELLLALADLHSRKEEYLSAKLGYGKMIRMYPASPLLARAKRSLASVLAEKLKEYDAAIGLYQDIAASYPGTGEAWTAYTRLPKLSERQKKYALAVEIYEKIIALYPEKAEAYAAFSDEARLLREEMEKPAEAVAVLNRLADKYKGEKALEALFLAAEISRKDMKDPAAEIKLYDRIVAEYPSDPQAPKALFAAAEVYEKSADLDQARNYYARVIAKYSDNSLAKKAQKRLDSLNGN